MSAFPENQKDQNYFLFYALSGLWQQTTILCLIHCLEGCEQQRLLMVLWQESIVHLFSAILSPGLLSLLASLYNITDG